MIRKSTAFDVIDFLGIFIFLSVIANIVLLLMLIAMATIFAGGQGGIFTEEVIQAGQRDNKIVVINVRGVIDAGKADEIYKQLKLTSEDDKVKGLIIRVNSPGGTVSGSDLIYNEIRKLREKTNKPIVAFMQGIAASGGYYTSVACDEIIAEPTVITGSVGVIMGYLVVQELFKEKLGILPVVVKSGRKKDWPSSFQQPTDEQLEYLQDKLIRPAYARFVQIIADNRASLTLDEVKRLSDGSIYGAQEALEEKMIDRIGYLDDAIERVSAMAGIEKAHVVEYRKPFSVADLLRSYGPNVLKIDRTTLYELSSPQVMYLWRAY